MSSSSSSSSSEEEIVDQTRTDSDRSEDEGDVPSSGDESDGELLEETTSEEEDDDNDLHATRDEDEEDERADDEFIQSMHADDVQSDEEVTKNTIGNVPLRWYDHLPHIGYDKSGQKIKRGTKLSAVDAAIKARDDPKYKWTVLDEYNGEERTLTERQLILLQRMRSGLVAHPEANLTPNYVPIYSRNVEIMPLSSRPKSKKSFVPSKSEELIIARLQKGIREGRIKIMKKKKSDEKDVFMIWNEDDWSGAKRRRGGIQMRMPKMATPGHAESYNPPDEYLPTPEERQKLEGVPPEDRPRNSFIPTKYDSLRQVPAYASFVKERFERCLDLYLCPAKVRRRKKEVVEPQSLVPNLPHPRELRPFPEEQVLLFKGHEDLVRSISISPSGQWLLSCGKDGTVRRWESDTGRCSAVWRFDRTPVHVSWNPNPSRHIAAVCVGKRVVILDMGTAVAHFADTTAACFEHIDGTNQGSAEEEDNNSSRDTMKNHNVKWRVTKTNAETTTAFSRPQKRQVEVVMKHTVRSVTWHSRGDYFATVCPMAPPSERVAVHLLSQRRTQHPFRRMKGIAQCVVFHPSKPIFFVATKKNVRVYHLRRQMLIKKLFTSSKHISSLSIHPNGDHVLVGTIDRRLVWFDLDLSSTPFKALRYHKKALRQALFHPRYPLMASASDDGTVHVFHAKVFSDLIQSPLIVPVKVLRGHEVVNDLGVLDISFHPTQPWIYTAGADQTIRLYQNIR